MSEIITKPILLDETGKRIVEKFKSIERAIRGEEYNSKPWILTFDISGPISNIAMSGDVKSWLTYRSKLGRYIVSTDGKARKLNKDNSNLFEDGTSYDITSGHIMTRFPNLYFTCVTDSNTVTITLSEKPFANCKAFGEQWIGSYIGNVLSDGTLVSRSGVNPTRSMTINSFWTAAQKNGSNWGLSDYRQRQMMMVIYLCEFLDANSQKCLGYGMNGNVNNWVSVVQNAITGKTNILGDRCGKVNFLEPGQNTSAACHVSLFGIEDPYGWFWQFIQGVYFGSSANTGQDGTECYIYEGNRMPTDNELITQPTGLFRKITRLTSEGWIKNLIWGENMDILPGVLGGDSATGHGDYLYASTTTGQVLLLGGSTYQGAECGLSFSDSTYDWAIVRHTTGARLAYYGVVDIV